MKQLILIGLLGLVPPQCEAVDELRCTCVVQLSLDERIRNSSEIFIAEVVAVSDTARLMHPDARHPFPAQHVRVASRQVWKGLVPDTTSVWLFTTEGLCGGRLAVGERWLILLDDADRNLRINMGSCSNAIRAERAGAVLRALGTPLREPAA
ncbi:MAG: hypothetical protein KF689_14340 [Gemmatimonadaceae bacterium]|nr:hypothetical protein [Gemmatimonadaceae bacterium]